MKSLLIVDDDTSFSTVLSRALSKHGFEVSLSHHVDEALSLARSLQPEYVVLDLNMPGKSGLTLIPRLRDIDPFTQIVVLTGYATVPTAVEAIKLGATHYLAKPVTAEEILAAFDRKEGDPNVEITPAAKHLYHLEWEHIERVLKKNNANISATARELGLHRRTLQRKLEKKPRP